MTTSKERVLNAIGHRRCDRLPLDYWATPETETKLLQHYGLKDRAALLDRLGVDTGYIGGPEYVGPELKVYDDGSSDDVAIGADEVGGGIGPIRRLAAAGRSGL